MDSSSSPNQDNFDRDKGAHVEDDQEEFETPESRGKQKEPPAASGATSQANKSTKTLPTRSTVWVHFTRTKANRGNVSAFIAKKDFSCATKSGTSNLHKHIGVCKQYKAWLEGQAEIQPQINEEGNLKIAKVSEPIWRETSNEILVLGELPLSFIESMAWKHFCNKVNMYKPHSRRTATRDIVEMYVQKKAALKKWFLAKQRVSLTTYIWVAQTTGAKLYGCHNALH